MVNKDFHIRCQSVKIVVARTRTACDPRCTYKCTYNWERTQSFGFMFGSSSLNVGFGFNYTQSYIAVQYVTSCGDNCMPTLAL